MVIVIMIIIHCTDLYYDQNGDSDESNEDADENLVDEAHDVVVSPTSLVKVCSDVLNKFIAKSNLSKLLHLVEIIGLEKESRKLLPAKEPLSRN